MKIKVLPLFRPSEAEKKDPTLFANNVRYQIASALNARISGHWYEDCKLYTSAIQLKDKLNRKKLDEKVNDFIRKKTEADEKRVEQFSQFSNKVADVVKATVKQENTSLPNTAVHAAKRVVEAKHRVQRKGYYLMRLVEYLFLEKSTDSDRVNLSQFEMQELKQIYGDKQSHLQEITFLLQKFIEVSHQKHGQDGQISYEEFCMILHLDRSTAQTKNLFMFFDRDFSGKIDFRDLALGLAYCSTKVNNSEKKRLAFDLFDTDGDGLISWDQFEQMFKLGEDNVSTGSAEDGTLDAIHLASLEALKKKARELISVKRQKQEATRQASDEEKKLRAKQPGTENVVDLKQLEASPDDLLLSYEVFEALCEDEPIIANHVLVNNNTGWKWNISALMEEAAVVPGQDAHEGKKQK